MVKKWKLGLGAACLAGALMLTVPISSSASGDVKISDTFPDTVFQSYVSGSRIDKDQDGFLSQDEMDAVVKIELYKKGVKNLEGIENFANLRELDVAKNELTSIDLSGNTKLLFLNCEDNALKALDLSANPEIVSIVAYNNQLEKVYLPKRDVVDHEAGTPMIKLAGNPNLRFVDMRFCNMRGGGYGEEDFDESTYVIWSSYSLGFHVINGKWMYLKDTGEYPETVAPETGWFKVDGKRYYAGDDGYLYTGKKTINGREYYFNPKGVLQEDIDWDKVEVLIDEKTFPNNYFRNYVADNIDKNEDGLLSKEEIEAVTAIYFCWWGSDSTGKLDGIEMFTNLETLECDGSGLTSLDVSMFKNLTSLSCRQNKLKTLDVSGLTNLKTLYCNDNQLTSLDVSKNKELTELDCAWNQLKTLDVSGLKKLEELNCSGNELFTLKRDGATAITWLYCSNTKLKSLDLRGLTKLKRLYSYGGELVSLNLSGLTNLVTVYCDDNKLKTLDVSGLTNLESLECNDNLLTSLDVSGNKNLKYLSCSSNKLTSLKLTGASSLEYLYCYGNELERLNIYKVPNLVTAYQKGTKDICSAGSGAKYLRYEYSEEGRDDYGDWYYYYYSLNVDPSLEKKIVNGQTGWITKNNKLYYYDEDAKLVKGKKTIGGATYYLDPTTGERKTGWQTISKKKYYFDPSTGKMKTGLQTISKKKYYFDPKTGEMKTGIQTVNKKKYFFDTKTGEMKTGWKTVSSKKYYFDPKSGEMKTGLQTINKKSYFFDTKTGAMKTGWQTISKKKYYFKANGVMARNEYVKGIYLDKKGVRSNKAKCTWKKDKKGKKYGNAKGWFAKGVTLTIDGKKYTFKKNGYVK